MTNRNRLNNCALLLAEALAEEKDSYFKGMLQAAFFLINKLADLYAWDEEVGR